MVENQPNLNVYILKSNNQMNKQLLSQPVYDAIYSRVPRICVDMIVMDDNKDILLIKRTNSPYKSYYNMPGGRIFFRESILSALNRISYREIGTHISDYKLIGTAEMIMERDIKQKRHSISLVYLVKLQGIAKYGTYFSKLPKRIVQEHANAINKYKESYV
jgi:ADP-ribose pyrophosphatase YjhB (NUDIX family)